VEGVDIPNRPAFRAQEVCEIAGVQPYVLRTWEAEFPDLGLAKTPQGPRVYRRADVERVLLIKQLLFVDGLTLAGARRRMAEQGLLPSAGETSDVDVTALADAALRQELQRVRRELHWMLSLLSGQGTVDAVSQVSRDSGAKRRRRDVAARGSRVGGKKSSRPKRK